MLVAEEENDLWDKIGGEGRDKVWEEKRRMEAGRREVV